jgi:hypothetical protein
VKVSTTSRHSDVWTLAVAFFEAGDDIGWRKHSGLLPSLEASPMQTSIRRKLLLEESSAGVFLNFICLYHHPTSSGNGPGGGLTVSQSLTVRRVVIQALSLLSTFERLLPQAFVLSP